MSADITSVPLRRDERWTAARMQQGRVLLDGDWNLNVDGPARDARQLARDAIGVAGVPVGSSAFEVTIAGGKITVGEGAMWVDGLLARNPSDLEYSTQDGIAPLPDGGLALVYLDVFPEEVQAAEDASLLDPALDRVDTVTRNRVGWRVRVRPTKRSECTTKGLPAPWSTGRLDVVRTSAPVSPDPCAPPDDPRAKLPDGLLRIEVLDAGDETSARFVWSYAGGSDAVAATFAGMAVSLAPSPAVTFAPHDLVEASTLARRADRVDHGALLVVDSVTPQAGGDHVTLASAAAVPGAPAGACLRRWDGEHRGAAVAVPATLAGADVGIAFTARPGQYEVGDWWGVRVRGSASDAVEERIDAEPDGARHAYAPLAVVDLDAGSVVSQCRVFFPPLTELRGGTCTVTAFPGDDLQAALDALPDSGGELCLAAGTYVLNDALRLSLKNRVVITGVGPATVLRAVGHEAVLIAERCDDVEVTNLRAEGGTPGGGAPGDEHLLGALTFFGCQGVRVHDCELSCPDSAGRAQAGVCVGATPDETGRASTEVDIARNRLEIGDQQTGILVTSAAVVSITENVLGLVEAPRVIRPNVDAVREFARFAGAHVVTDEAGRGDVFTLPGDERLRVAGSSQVRRLAADFAASATPEVLRKSRTSKAAFERFVSAALLRPQRDDLSRGSRGFVTAAATTTRSMGQGIVVGGRRAFRVRIERNHVLAAIQGVHVGFGQGREAESVEQVVISGNTIENVVPFFWGRQRHAFYVGSSASTTMIDNHASLTRGGFDRDDQVRRSPVEAVRIWGRLGPYLQVRGLDLRGAYAVGVHIVDTGSTGNERILRYVSDVLNSSGGAAVDVPASVLTERCVP